jgi:uncharacterized membrane protein
MESKAKFLGHPIHQMLIVFPLGLLMTAWLLDIGFLVTRNATLATVAYWNIALGIGGGLVAAFFGLIDWLAIPIGTRAKSVGAWHGGCNVVMLTVFGASWILRHPAPEHAPTPLAFVLGCLAVAIAGVGGWLGGELVNRLGVGVSPRAGLNAPSSLSKTGENPAGEAQR